MRFYQLLLAVLAIGSSTVVLAANPRLLLFEKPTQDLGTVREVDGVVTLRYTYTNVTQQPVTILDIHSQCGCVQSQYDHKPLLPGKQAVVTVKFDPKDRLSDFNIGLTVIASNGAYRKFNTLVVKGSVESRIPESTIRYPYQLSAALRADLGAIGMRQIRRDDTPPIKQLRVFNTSDKTVKISCRTGSRHISVSYPEQIESGKEAILTFRLDPRNMPTGKFALEATLDAAGEHIPIAIKGLIFNE